MPACMPASVIPQTASKQTMSVITSDSCTRNVSGVMMNDDANKDVPYGVRDVQQPGTLRVRIPCAYCPSILHSLRNT